MELPSTVGSDLNNITAVVLQFHYGQYLFWPRCQGQESGLNQSGGNCIAGGIMALVTLFRKRLFPNWRRVGWVNITAVVLQFHYWHYFFVLVGVKVRIKPLSNQIQS